MANIHMSDRKPGARRNLSDSFNESSSITSPIQNYSIISPDESEEINDLKLRMRKSLSSILNNKSILELSQSLKNNLQIDKSNPHVAIARLSVKQHSPELMKSCLSKNDLQSNSSQKLRRSTRNIQRISYVDLISPPKTPKRNRKYSTCSEASSAADGEYLSPSKKAYTQSSNKLNNKTKLNKLENTIKCSPKKRNDSDSEGEQILEITQTSTYCKRNISKSKHSTPVEKIHCTPTKRNSNIPTRYLDYFNDISPTKKKKTVEMKECFVNSDSLDVDKVRSPAIKNKRNSHMNPIVKLNNNLNTPKQVICYQSETGVKNILSNKSQHFSNVQTPKSLKNTPSAKVRLIREGIVTPSVQARTTPIQKNCTPLNKARAKLHVSYLPDILPCRGKEYENIFNFVEGKLLDGCGG